MCVCVSCLFSPQHDSQVTGSCIRKSDWRILLLFRNRFATFTPHRNLRETGEDMRTEGRLDSQREKNRSQTFADSPFVTGSSITHSVSRVIDLRLVPVIVPLSPWFMKFLWGFTPCSGIDSQVINWIRMNWSIPLCRRVHATADGSLSHNSMKSNCPSQASERDDRRFLSWLFIVFVLFSLTVLRKEVKALNAECVSRAATFLLSGDHQENKRKKGKRSTARVTNVSHQKLTMTGKYRVGMQIGLHEHNSAIPQHAAHNSHNLPEVLSRLSGLCGRADTHTWYTLRVKNVCN